MEQNNNDQSLRDAVRDAMQDAMRDQHQMMQQMLQTMQAMMARMEVQNRAQPVRLEERGEIDGGRERGFENLEAPPIRREQQRHEVGLPREHEASAKKRRQTTPSFGGHRNPNERSHSHSPPLLFPAPSYTPAERRNLMAGLSLYRDGASRDLPLLSACGGPALSLELADPEAELRRLFDQIAGDSSSESPGSNLFERWVQSFFGEGDDGGPYDRRFSLTPDLRRKIETLIHKLLSDRLARSKEAGSLGSSLGSSKRKVELEEMLLRVRGFAIDPCAGGGERRQWKKQVLKLRGALYLSKAEFASIEDFPSYPRRKRKNGKQSTAVAQKKLRGTLNQPKRRSQRIARKLNVNERHLVTLRKRIGVGASFQADVPEWTGPPDVKDVYEGNEDLDDSRWLGTRVWPAEGDDRKTSEAMIGKSRPDLCGCASPGSVACIRSHVSTARLQLQSDLGHAFFSLGFDRMGEEISKLVEHMEARMKEDVMAEVTRSGGQMLLHREEFNPATGQPSVIGYWEKISPDDVQTPTKVYVALKAKGYTIKYKMKADQQRRQQSFEVGDLVWVYLPRERYPQGALTKLKPKKIGPCQVLEKFGDNAYRVELPDDVFISDVFNIRHLTPYAGENSSLRSSFSEEGESDEDISSDQGSGQSSQSLDVPVPATQSQHDTSGKPTPGSLRRSKRLLNKRA